MFIYYQRLINPLAIISRQGAEPPTMSSLLLKTRKGVFESALDGKFFLRGCKSALYF